MKKIVLCVLFICLFILGGCDNQINNEKTKEKSNQTKQIETKEENKQQGSDRAETLKQEQRNLLQSKLDSVNATYSTGFSIKSFGETFISITDSSAVIENNNSQDFTAEYTLVYDMFNYQYNEISTYCVSPDSDFLLQNKFPKEVNYFLILAESLEFFVSDQKDSISAFLLDAGEVKQTTYTNISHNLIGFVKEYVSLNNIRYKLTISVNR